MLALRTVVGTIGTLILLTGLSAQSSAQDSVAAGSRWMSGVSAGVPALREAVPLAFTISGTFTQLRSAPGLDLAAGTLPYVFSVGVPNLFLRGGMAWPLEAGHVVIVPSGGVSVLAAVSSGGGGGDMLLQGGMAIVLLNESRRGGVRIAASLHQSTQIDRVWLVEMGWVSIRNGK